MTASSSYLNRPLRSEAEYLAEHSPRFCRQVLMGAFERRYDENGKWVGYTDMRGNLLDLNLNPFKTAAE